MKMFRAIAVLILICIIAPENSFGITTTSLKPTNSTAATTLKALIDLKTTITPVYTTLLLQTSSLITTTTTICEANSSCTANNVTKTTLTTTPIPAMNISLKNESQSTVSTTKTPSLKKSSRNSRNNICICDLKVQYCDINCCCDKDCTVEDKLIFDHCEEEFHYYDTRYCDYMKYIYVNNTQREWQISQNDLFCVVRSNLPPSYTIQRKHPLKTFNEAEYERRNKYSWPISSISASKLQFVDVGSNYSYGQPIWIVSNNTLDNFWFPQSFITHVCIMKDKIKYLIDSKSSCSQTQLNEENQSLKASTYFRNISVIAAPNLLNISKLQSKFWQCPKNVCLPIEPKFCDDNYENCVVIAGKNYSKLETLFHLNISTNKLTCRNLVKKVKYNFYHNGIKGLKKIEIFLILSNITFHYNIADDKDFLQEFEINFLWSNKSLNYSSHLSGNPGYLSAKPILIANLIGNNSTSNESNNISSENHQNFSTRLFRNSQNFGENFMVLSDNENGRCILDKNKYIPIEFGFNMLTKCDANGFVANNKNSTAKYICSSIQETLFKYWSLVNKTNGSLFVERVVGQFGNSNVYKEDEWISIMFKNDPKDVINNTWGFFSSDNKTVYCGNITTLFATDIYHARVDFENVLNQEKILAVTFRFENFRNISFNYNLLDTFFNFNIMITSQVMFYDITTPKKKKLVEPPSLHIKLPYDFFYPFVKLGNRSAGMYFSLSVGFICVILLCIF